jgi:hypothetical protein
MNETDATTAPNESPGGSAQSDTLHGGLRDAKAHAKEAARSTLLAMRSALDFALDKLADKPGSNGDPGDAVAPSDQPASAQDSNLRPSD